MWPLHLQRPTKCMPHSSMSKRCSQSTPLPHLTVKGVYAFLDSHFFFLVLQGVLKKRL